MSTQPATETGAREVPFGIVLITVGLIMLFTVALILAFSPVPLPLSDQLRLAVVAVLPGTADYFPRAPVADTAVSPTIENGAILLPESPSENRLPSVATVAEAAVIRRDPLPGQPSRLVIPRIELDAPVSAISLETVDSSSGRFYQWAVPNRFEAGWHDSSAPLDQPGNTVLNGHQNIYGEVFRDLIDLEIGDEITLYDQAGTPHLYRVTQLELLEEVNQPLAIRVRNARWIEETADERVTLVTCWPYTANTHRLIVVAQPVDEASNSQ